MYYALIHDEKIQVGPRSWNYNFFKKYLEEAGLNYDAVTISAPENNMIITDEWRIIPVDDIPVPEINPNFEQPAGPFLTIYEDHVSGYYTVIPIEVEASKNKLKEIVTQNRYTAEVGGCNFTLNDGTEVTIYTTREDRNVYLQAYQIISEGQTITFKFPGAVFKAVDKEELGRIVQAGATHIQNAFNWEAAKYSEIDACTTLDELRLIDINYAI